MKHTYTEKAPSSAHYGVSKNTLYGTILVQVGDEHGNQSRIALTVEQAKDFRDSLDEIIGSLEQS